MAKLNGSLMARANGKDRGIFERPKGSKMFWIRYAGPDGKEHRECAGTKSQAKALYQKRKVAIRTGEKLPELVKAKIYTFEDLADYAITWSKENKKSSKDDVQRLGVLKSEFGKRAANDIEAAEFEVFLDELQEDAELANATINRYRAALMLAYREGRRRGRVKNNPARDISHRRESDGVVRMLSDEEERRLVPHIHRFEHRTEFYFSLLTGARKGEQFSLKWDDVDLKARTAMLRSTNTKNGTSRQIELHTSLISMLEMLPRDESGYVFRSGKVHRGYFMGWLQTALAKANIENFRWHDLRHTFASRLVIGGVDLARVQRAMGHKAISMTMKYAHLRQEHVREAIDTLAPVTLEPQNKEAVN